MRHVGQSTIASLPLQELRPSHLERYFAELGGAALSRRVYFAVLHRALLRAVKEKKIAVSPMDDVERRKEKVARSIVARQHTGRLPRRGAYMEAAKLESPQIAAYLFLALDSGARRSELDGLQWKDVDLDAGKVTISQQLDRGGDKPPVFGPTKTGMSRDVVLNAATITQLRKHRQAQNELKLKNRAVFQDFGLVFSKEVIDCQRRGDALGQAITTLGDRSFARVVAAAKVKKIKFHGLRHTAATLMLAAGVAPHVAADRLGHSVAMLLQVYTHVVGAMKEDAAARLGEVLAGR